MTEQNGTRLLKQGPKAATSEVYEWDDTRRKEVLQRDAEMDRGENLGAPLDETVQRLIEKYS